jgi:hypothetical protein
MKQKKRNSFPHFFMLLLIVCILFINPFATFAGDPFNEKITKVTVKGDIKDTVYIFGTDKLTGINMWITELPATIGIRPPNFYDTDALKMYTENYTVKDVIFKISKGNLVISKSRNK